VSSDTPSPAIRPPVALGCTAAAAAVGLVVIAVVLAVAFLDSGADNGEAVLEPAETYARGSVTRVADRGIYLVRLLDGSFLALGDLDAANRATAGTRCRVAPIASDAPELPGLLARYQSAFAPQAAGASLIFREECNGALYDATGVRLGAAAPNLDRFPVVVNGQGRVAVNLARRECTQRVETNQYANVACPK